jgi:hypothetical protein
MASDMQNALEIIKISGLLQASRIKDLEASNANLISLLKQTMSANNGLKAEIEGLNRNLEAKTSVIKAMLKDFDVLSETYTALEIQVQMKIEYLVGRIFLYVLLCLSLQRKHCKRRVREKLTSK